MRSIDAVANSEEIRLDDELESVDAPKEPDMVVKRETRFIALDKCLPARQFLEVSGLGDERAYISVPSHALHPFPLQTEGN